MKVIQIVINNIWKIISSFSNFLFKSKLKIMSWSLVSKDCNIWKNTYIWYNCWITKTNIWNYCSIANNVSIGMWEHDINKVSTNSIFYNNTYSELTKLDCTIWNDVWIWVDSIIRRWIQVGNWAVIWANSFVNKNIPPYAIVWWNPAKIIKYRFSEKKINEIENSNWWKYDYKEAKEIINNIK